jgi:hypothetical protein
MKEAPIVLVCSVLYVPCTYRRTKDVLPTPANNKLCKELQAIGMPEFPRSTILASNSVQSELDICVLQLVLWEVVRNWSQKKRFFGTDKNSWPMCLSSSKRTATLLRKW